MRMADVVRQHTTPLGSAGAYPRGRYHFHNREYLNITYRTERAALEAVVPEPLEIDEPLVKFEVMKMPDVTGLGSYTESGQIISVRYNGEPAEFLHAMYVDNHPAIASGREFGAYPKKLGHPKLYVDSDTLVGTLDYGSLRVAVATMGYKHRELDETDALAELCSPTYMLKIMRGYTGRPRICELLRTQITDVNILGAWRGPARLQLFQHVLAPMADMPVLEIVSATHILTDLTLAPFEVAYDYLT
ncbi:MAG: acetoacetate decarboxylase [Acidimicrobiales bacterium]